MEQYTAQQILKVRDALVERNLDEAYHQLYTLADPEYKIRANPWEDVERIAASPAKAEQEGPWKREAEEWKLCYDVVLSALKELTDLKAIKERDGETADYLQRKPKAWEVAKELTAGHRIERREQEGLRWVKGCPPERKLYHAKYRFLKEDTEVKEGLVFPLKDTHFWEAISINSRNYIEDIQIVEYLLESAPKEAGQVDPVSFAEWVYEHSDNSQHDKPDFNYLKEIYLQQTKQQ